MQTSHRPQLSALPRVLALVTSSLGLGLVSPSASGDCVVILNDIEDTISLEIAPGRNIDVEIGGMTKKDGDPSCSASAFVPLSAFPTSRLALRPVDIVQSLRDVVEKIGAKECSVRVYFDNDTGEELAAHELCLTETFRFGERKAWSISREPFCWEPDLDEEQIVSVD